MAKTVIKFSLDSKDIDRAIRELKQFKKEFLEKCNRLVEALTDYGVEVARIQVAQLDAVYTGELMNSIDSYYSPTYNVGIIKAGAYYAPSLSVSRFMAIPPPRIVPPPSAEFQRAITVPIFARRLVL